MMLSRRGAFGMATLLGLTIKPEPARGVTVSPAIGETVYGDLLERTGQDVIWPGQTEELSFEAYQRLMLRRIAGALGIPEHDFDRPAPAGWHTLENVR